MSPGLRVFVVALLGVGCAVAQAVPSGGAPSVAEARALLTQGKLDDALRELNTLADEQPKPAGVERLRGIAFYEKNQMDDAQRSFARALEENPADLESAQMRGVVLYRLGKPAEAIPWLEKAHSSGMVANADPNYVLALCFIATKRNDDARHAFAAQYGFPPDSAAAWLVTARMLFRQEQTADAVAAARKALQADARIPLAHRLLGEIDLANGDAAGALAEFQQELKVDPLDGETYDRMGDAYVRSGQYAQAQQVLDRAVLLEPNATGPYILLGKALLAQHDPATAAMYLERAVKMDPSSAMGHMLLGRALTESGRKADAAKEFEALQKLQGAPAAANP
jgi:predicted Zn-dependent protease